MQLPIVVRIPWLETPVLSRRNALIATPDRLFDPALVSRYRRVAVLASRPRGACPTCAGLRGSDRVVVGNRQLILLLLFLGAAWFAGAAGAAGSNSLTTAEDDGLPEYCIAMNAGGKEKQKWLKKLGKYQDGLKAHFCLAAAQVHRVRTGVFDDKPDPDGMSRRALKGSIKQVRYYEKRLPKGHFMLGEVHRMYAAIYGLLGDREKEREHERLAANFGQLPGTGGKRSIAASAQPYVDMADKMMEVGIPAEAVELLELAERLSPNSAVIQNKLERARAAMEAR